MASEEYVKEVFRNIHSKYDLIDSIISFGMDEPWRNRMIAIIDREDIHDILDCGAGTGKLSRKLVQRFPLANVTALDISGDMLSFIHDNRIRPITASAMDMPFENGSFDLITSAFLTRNVPDRNAYFSEVRRLLRPKGLFINLDIHLPENHVLRKLFSIYFLKLVPAFGDMVSGSSSYTYLSASVRNFVSPQRLSEEIMHAGFKPAYLSIRAIGSISIGKYIKI
jgi:demethylmenaquinone methyltransferase/2-methoxy-6-polyprenyl-1,4-benzoquinol methylase